MLILGAGSSAPLGIPTMKGFVDTLKDMQMEKSELELTQEIRYLIEHLDEYLDMKISYDLESLMAVLEDLAGGEKSPSHLTTGFLVYLSKKGIIQTPSLKELREKFGSTAKRLLTKVRGLIHAKCMGPGEKISLTEENIDRVYGPLLMLFASVERSSGFLAPDNTWVFTTNWDLCFKKWVAVRDLKLDDGATQDPQGRLVLDVSSAWKDTRNGFNFIPLHGSLDLIRRKASMVGGRHYEFIEKVSIPERLSGEDLRSLFMIYPLEAGGYESVAKSPHLDMLHLLKVRLLASDEDVVYIIGASLRDMTMASVFEDALRIRRGRGTWTPLSGSDKERIEDALESPFKVILISADAKTVVDNLERRGFFNFSRAIIPIEGEIPEVNSQDFNDKYSSLLRKIGEILKQLFKNKMAPDVYTRINHEFHLDLYKPEHEQQFAQLVKEISEK